MASNIRRIIYNTRERITSTDFNDATNLHHRALIEQLAHVTGRLTGVVHGFETTIPGSGLDVTVSPGLALLDEGVASGDDSEFAWVELTTAQTLAVTTPDATNPRWDVVEVVPGSAVELSTLRDVFNSTTGTFTSQTLEKRRTSSPTLQIRAGTPAATPVFPAGVAGAIPLAYVYVPAGVANLVVGDEVLCRPLISAEEGRFRVSGGGISSNEPTDNGVRVEPIRGAYEGARFQFEVASQSALTAVAGTYLGGALPVSDAHVYFYLVKPPYPTGYGPVAEREFVPGTSASALWAAQGGSFARNCLIVADTVFPSTYTPQGAPGSVSGGLTAAGFGTTSVSASDLVYLGSIYRDVGNDEYHGQVTRGDQVYHLRRVSPVVRTPSPSETITNALGSPLAANIYTFGSSIVGVARTAQRAVHYQLATGASSDIGVEISHYAFEEWHRLNNNVAGTELVQSGVMHPDALGNFEVGRVVHAGGSDPVLRLVGYQDEVLATR